MVSHRDLQIAGTSMDDFFVLPFEYGIGRQIVAFRFTDRSHNFIPLPERSVLFRINASHFAIQYVGMGGRQVCFEIAGGRVPQLIGIGIDDPVGRLLIRLAEEAETVERIICGMGQKIK